MHKNPFRLPFILMRCGLYSGSLLIVGLLYGCCHPEISASVPNTLRPQQTDNWCWAATTQMLAQHFGIAIDQCKLASDVLKKPLCCSPSSDPNDGCRRDTSCNKPGNVELTRIGLTFKESNTPLSWADLQEQLYCAKKPMGFAYGWPGRVGHVLVIKGYITVGNTQYLILNDPWAPCTGEERLITYDEYQDPNGPMPNDSTTHWTTYYNLAKK